MATRLRNFAIGVVVVIVSALGGAFGGGQLFQLVWTIPAMNEIGIRAALAVAGASAILCVWTLIRLFSRRPSLDIRLASPFDSTLAAVGLVLIGWRIGTTFFR